MLDCSITGVSQDMDFEQSVTVTYLLVRLPNGETIRAAVDENAAATVIAMQVQTNGAPRAAVQPPARRPGHEVPLPPQDEDTEDYSTAPPGAEEPAPETGGDNVHVFGGQDDGPPPPPADEEEEEPAPEPPPPPPTKKQQRRSNVQRTASGKIIVPSKTVPKTDMGYPVVPNAGVDTEEFTGGRDRDEDGVGSV